MTEDELLTLWGKTEGRNPNVAMHEYHPLLFHLLDVGNAAKELWKLLPQATKQRIAVALGISVEEAERIVVLLTAIHDLGKASAFQEKAPNLWHEVQKIGLTILGNIKDHPHAFVTADSKVLPTLLRDKTAPCGWYVSSLPLANALSAITGAHHGNFPDGENLGHSTLGGEKWIEAREELAKTVARCLYPKTPTIHLDEKYLQDCGVGTILTGFIAVADWVGSAADYFPAKGRMPLDEYAKQSETQAKKAIEDFGWRTPTFTTPAEFSEIFPFAPNPMQEAVATFAKGATTPYLLIVEAAMGQGKTEAALYATDRGNTTGQNPGFYIALPTQATGNAMEKRVENFLTERKHTSSRLNLQLVHGGAAFNANFDKLRQLGVSGADTPIVAESWFTNKKQALLAPFGVGTIDQTLMGVLQTKHWFVRLFGLAGKVVVFDEVHAYDTYMSELLQTLIAWLAELDCTVILLSATLPTKKREQLMQAYQQGASVEVKPYPRVTYVPKSGIAQCAGVEENTQAKTITLEYHAPDYPKLAEKLKLDLPNGGCGVVICNTVAQAQKAFEAMQNVLEKEGWETFLFHARTPLAWRKEKEDKVLSKFGKESDEVVRPPKSVLISTQVVEQSLDLDFDWMASEMAPIDLLLQRMGRLWRHENRKNRREIPEGKRRFVVLGEGEGEGDNLPHFPSGSTLIYDEYILLRSWLALQGKDTITLPQEIEPLVNAVYDGEPSSPNATWQERLEIVKGIQSEKAKADRNVAWENTILSPTEPSVEEFCDVLPKQSKTLKDDDDPEMSEKVKATTRLGESSIQIICLREEGGKHFPFCDLKNRPVDLAKQPYKELLRLLIESSVSVSRPRGLYHALVREGVPASWEKDAHLRYARCLIFTEGKAQVGKYVLTLNKVTGLSIEKENTKESTLEKEQEKEGH
jgi:CRISPR-associated endonuclease/helicase Cas3